MRKEVRKEEDLKNGYVLESVYPRPGTFWNKRMIRVIEINEYPVERYVN